MPQAMQCVSIWVYAASNDNSDLIMAVKRWLKSKSQEIAVNGVAYNSVDHTPRTGKGNEKAPPLVEIVVASPSRGTAVYAAGLLLRKLREHQFTAEPRRTQPEAVNEVFTPRYTRICWLMYQNAGPMTNRQLRELFGTSRPAMASILRELTAKALVRESHRTKSDRGLPTVHYVLTSKGQEYALSRQTQVD